LQAKRNYLIMDDTCFLAVGFVKFSQCVADQLETLRLNIRHENVYRPGLHVRMTCPSSTLPSLLSWINAQ